jgi:transposase
MLRVSISPEDVEIIQRERYYHPQPHIMMRMHILAHHHKGMSAATIAELLDRDQRTVRTCLTTYRDGGLQAVYQYEKHKKECELDTHSALIEKEFEQRPPHSIKEARARIAELTGITRGLTQVEEFLKKRLSLFEGRKHSLQSRPGGSEGVFENHNGAFNCRSQTR